MFVSSLRPRTPGAGEGLGMRAFPKQKKPRGFSADFVSRLRIREAERLVLRMSLRFKNEHEVPSFHWLTGRRGKAGGRETGRRFHRTEIKSSVFKKLFTKELFLIRFSHRCKFLKSRLIGFE